MAKLLYVVNIPRFFITHRLPLALAAQRAGYEVHVATSDADTENVAAIKAAGLPYHPLPLSQHGTHPLQEWRTLMALWELYIRLKPELVHHVSIKPVLYGGLVAPLSPVRGVVHALSGLGYLFTDEGAKARVLRVLLAPLLRLALDGRRKRVIFQNFDDRALLVKRRLVHFGNTVLIRGSGVDTDVFAPTPYPYDTPPLVLFAGRLLWQKGVREFVEAARVLRGRARFVIVGYPEPTSPYAVPLETLQAWDAAGDIAWWGKRDDMPAVLAQASVVCLPSTYGEGVPKILIEAAACARPLVATDVAGCREIVHDDVNGLLVPPRNSDALAQAIGALLDDPPRAARMGQAGRRLVEQEFALELVVQQTLAVYQTLLEQA